MQLARAAEPAHLSQVLAAEVLVLHANPLLAAGLGSALAAQLQVAVLAADAAWPLLREARASLVVTDHARALQLLAQGGGLWSRRLLVVDEALSARQLRRALDLGVAGCVHIGCPLPGLLQAVQALRGGQSYLCRTMSDRLVDTLDGAALTPREQVVFELLCDGLDNKSIAQGLDMALGTVKTHVKSILAKLGVSSRTQALACAHRHGLVPTRTSAPRADRASQAATSGS